MKLVVIEPIGVEQDKLLMMGQEILGNEFEIICYPDRVTETAALIERGKDADVMIVSNLPMNDEVIRGCKNLKLLSVAFTGVDHIAIETCKELGITVCNSAGYSNAAVADLVFGMIISLYRNLSDCDKATRTSGTKDGLIGFELEGKKFGVIGTGAIGMRVATIANAFGCEVYGYSRTAKKDTDISYIGLEELLKTCDIVSLHVPLNLDTKGFIGSRELALMKDTALLVNTARGSVVDNEALAKALKAGTIAGAAIDVFDMEPPIPTEYPLLNAPNSLLAPHVGFATKEALVKRAVIVFDNVKAFKVNEPQNVIC